MAGRGNDEIGVNLRELCIEEKEIDSNPSDECLEKEQWSGETKDNVNRQQRYGPRKQLTRNWNVEDIDSPLDKSNYREMVYINKNGVLEELFGYLGLKKDKKTQIKFGGIQSIQ